MHFKPILNAIDIDFDCEVVLLTGYCKKVNTPDFNKINRCQNGDGVNFKQDSVE